MTKHVSEKLLEMATESANLSPQEILTMVACPEWPQSPQMYDWRRHVLDELHGLWEGFSTETRLALFITANRDAESEDWEDQSE